MSESEFDRGVEPALERRCAVCGTDLNAREIEASQETGGPFLCSVHAEEELPIVGDDAEGIDPDGGAGAL